MLIKKSTLAVVGTVLALGLWQANQSSLSIAGLSWDSRDQPERVEDLIAPSRRPGRRLYLGQTQSTGTP